jgi:hypothetical protein
VATYAYEDFAVEFRRGEGRVYDVRASDAAGVEATGTFVLDLDDAQLTRAVGLLGRTRDIGVGERSAQELTAQELGSRLAQALLADSVGALFDGALRRADAAGHGLRLRLSLAATPELLDVPWELLYRRPTFLASQRRTPVVRYLDTGKEPPRQRIEGVVRVLGVIANPRDLEHLDVADERNRLERALASMIDDGLVKLDWLEPATSQGLRRTLRDGNYHVLHFIGHGGMFGDEGVLMLEGEGGAAAPLTTTVLDNLLADQRSLCLVVLNSCRGARATLTDPFAGVATSLVALGVSAVVAMQFSISDAAAIAFAEELYTALIARRMPVDAAVAEGRKAVLSDVNEVEWATPVLFSHSADGLLFDFRGPPPEPTRRHRRVAWAVAAGLVAFAGAGSVIVLSLTRGGDGGETAGTRPVATQPAVSRPATTQPATTQPATTQPATTRPAAGAASATETTIGTFDRLPECPTPNGAGWTDLGVTGSTHFGQPPVEFTYVLEGGAFQELDSGGRQEVFELTATLSKSSPSSEYTYWWFYELDVGSARIRPTCMSVLDLDPLPAGASTGVLVGFQLQTAAGAPGILLISDTGDKGRIDLTST